MSGGELHGRHAIVTGGGRGIGAAISRELARLGAAVTIMGRNPATLDARTRALRDELGPPTRVQAITCDVTDEGSVREAFAAAAADLGAAYVLVNNAGDAEAALVHEMSLDTWEATLAVNLTGTFLCSREVLPDMLAAGEGRIVNIASTAAFEGFKRMAAYCAAKHGVLGLTRALAAETARAGVTVNAVCPGYTADTDMTRRAVAGLVAAGRTEEAALSMLAGANPQGRLVRPEEIARMVAWLCSAETSEVTGRSIVVGGGDVP